MDQVKTITGSHVLRHNKMGSNVRFGSKPDIEACPLDVCFTPQKRTSILGLRIERTKLGGPGEFEAMSDSELLAAIRERLAHLDADTRH